jgi:hypothetical protein
MSRDDGRTGFAWWEYVVYVAVTIPLLLIGLVLWLFGLLFKAAALVRGQKTDD